MDGSFCLSECKTDNLTPSGENSKKTCPISTCMLRDFSKTIIYIVKNPEFTIFICKPGIIFLSSDDFFSLCLKDECIKFVTRATFMFVFPIDFKSFGIWRGLKLVMNVS